MVRYRRRWVRHRGGGSEAHLIRYPLRLGLQFGIPFGSLLEALKEKGVYRAFAQRALAGCVAILLAITTWANDHAVPKTRPMALWSTHEIPSGVELSELEVILEEYFKGEEKRGLNNCTMYKHEFGSPRAVYTTCTFDDSDHFARIMEGSPSVASPDDLQLFGSHMDHIVLMTKQGMTKMPK